MCIKGNNKALGLCPAILILSALINESHLRSTYDIGKSISREDVVLRQWWGLNVANRTTVYKTVWCEAAWPLIAWLQATGCAGVNLCPLKQLGRPLYNILSYCSLMNLSCHFKRQAESIFWWVNHYPLHCMEIIRLVVSICQSIHLWHLRAFLWNPNPVHS